MQLNTHVVVSFIQRRACLPRLESKMRTEMGVKGKPETLFVRHRNTCSLRIVKQQGVNVFNKKILSSIGIGREKNPWCRSARCRRLLSPRRTSFFAFNLLAGRVRERFWDDKWNWILERYRRTQSERIYGSSVWQWARTKANCPRSICHNCLVRSASLWPRLLLSHLTTIMPLLITWELDFFSFCLKRNCFAAKAHKLLLTL